MRTCDAMDASANRLGGRRPNRWIPRPGRGGALTLAAAALLVGGWVVGAQTDGVMESAGAATMPAAAGNGFARAFVVPITDEINDITLQSFERRIETAKKGDADLIIVELNTPGGVANAALKICKVIKNLRPIHTVAWVNSDAYSAGAIIAVACDEIVMSARSSIGDCQPIMIGPEGPGAVPEDIQAKVNSPLIEELQDSSNRNGYDLNLLLAMVRPEMELFWVENTQTGERRFVQAHERDQLFGIESLEEKTEPAPDDAKKVDDKAKKPVKRKNPTEPVPDALSKTSWRYVRSAPGLAKVRQPIVGSNELLTMGQDVAIAYGISKGKVSSDAELRDFFAVRGSTTRLEYSHMEKVVDWLSSPLVRGVLFILMMLGAYVEFNHPGFSLPGLVALVCLIIFLGAPYLTGLAKAWEILVVICGVGLLLLELFVIPGFGITGVAGLLLIIIGFVATFMPEDPGPIYRPEFKYTVDGVKTGLWVIAIGLTASVAGMFALSRFMPRMPYLRKLIPDNPTLEAVAVVDALADVARVGDVGLTEGPLRPAGKARFGSTLVDVVSDGEFLPPGERVEVIDREGNRVVVRRIRGSA